MYKHKYIPSCIIVMSLIFVQLLQLQQIPFHAANKYQLNKNVIKNNLEKREVNLHKMVRKTATTLEYRLT